MTRKLFLPRAREEKGGKGEGGLRLGKEHRQPELASPQNCPCAPIPPWSYAWQYAVLFRGCIIFH